MPFTMTAEEAEGLRFLNRAAEIITAGELTKEQALGALKNNRFVRSLVKRCRMHNTDMMSLLAA